MKVIQYARVTALKLVESADLEFNSYVVLFNFATDDSISVLSPANYFISTLQFEHPVPYAITLKHAYNYI